MEIEKSKPVLKWAGGKTQLLPQLQAKYPNFHHIAPFTYIEPFFGGGAVFFDMINNHCHEMEKSIINDINPNLVNLYRVVRDEKNKLCSELKSLKANYLLLDSAGKKEYFLFTREEFNKIINLPIDPMDTKNNQSEESIRRAAMLVFLNKTCFNGLYRVNSKGLFNVPFSNYKNPAIYDKENIYRVSQSLQTSTILCGDYHELLDFVDNSSFIYLDPPYRPLTKTSSFNAYDLNVFNDESQRKLKTFVDKCNSKKASFLLSNSDPKNNDVNDCFFDDLYSNYNIDRVLARRSISSKASTRKQINEIIIKNY